MTPDQILAHLRALPEDAPAVIEGLWRFAEWSGDIVFPLIDSPDDGGIAMVGRATPPEDSPVASWRPPWIKAQVWVAPPHESWHSNFEDARTAVEAHLTANGWTVLPRRTP